MFMGGNFDVRNNGFTKQHRLIMPNIPLPAKLVAKKQAEEEAKEPTGKDWWSLRNISGAVGPVKDAIRKSTIPDYWKGTICADIDARCGDEFNFVYVDAHYFVEKGQASIHLTISPDKHLL